MRKRTSQLTKGLMLSGIFLVYQAPGCSLVLDEATIQSLLNSLGAFSDVKFELEFEADGGGGQTGVQGELDHD